MGMGYGANFADTIEQGELIKIAPKEWKALEKSVEKDEEDMDFNLSEIASGNEIEERIKTEYDNFVDAVYKNTGMDVEVFYHNSEDQGDRYDEVEGVFWHVNNAYIKNPKITRGNQQKIERQFFVTYG
jgi:hypothetical protein